MQKPVFPTTHITPLHRWNLYKDSNLQYTAHFKGKNLLWNNSSWDFEGIVDTMDPYLFFPDGNFSPHTYLTNIFGTRKMGAGVDKIFIFPKRSIREKFRLQNLGVAEVFFAWKCCLLFILTTFLNSSCKLSQHHLDRYERGKKYLSGTNQ